MTPTKKIALMIFIWLLLTGAAFTFLFPKMAISLVDLQSSHQQQIDHLKDLQEQVQALQKTQDDLSRLSSQSVKPTDLFTSDLHLVNEIKQIEQYAQKNNLIETLTVSGTADKAAAVQSASGLYQVPYSIVLKGAFPGVIDFIQYLENSYFISPVNGISVIFNSPGNVSATIVSNFYISRQ
jgi:Tfp pilus assembly protein PilO